MITFWGLTKNWQYLWCNKSFLGINSTKALAHILGKKNMYIKSCYVPKDKAHISNIGTALGTRGNLARACARGAGPPQTVEHRYLPNLGRYRTPGDEGQVVGRKGRKRTETGVRKPTGRPWPAGCGRAEWPRKYSSIFREDSGTRTVVRGTGEGGGGKERRAPQKLRQGTSVSTKSVGLRES